MNQANRDFSDRKEMIAGVQVELNFSTNIHGQRAIIWSCPKCRIRRFVFFDNRKELITYVMQLQEAPEKLRCLACQDTD